MSLSLLDIRVIWNFHQLYLLSKRPGLTVAIVLGSSVVRMRKNGRVLVATPSDWVYKEFVFQSPSTRVTPSVRLS